MIRRNPNGEYPKIDNTSYIDPTAVIIGKVKIGKNVFVGPGAIIRADEPSSSITLITNNDKTNNLQTREQSLKKFAGKVVKTNLDLVKKYKKHDDNK